MHVPDGRPNATQQTSTTYFLNRTPVIISRMSHLEHRATSPAHIRCYVLTISDTRTEEDDTGGQLLRNLLVQDGHEVIGHAIVRDEAASVRAAIERQLDIYRRELDALDKPFPDELPLMREIFVAGSRVEAMRLARPYLEAKYKAYHEWGQDKAMPPGDDDLSLAFDELLKDRFLFGSPDEVAEQIIGYNSKLGVNSFILGMQWLGMPHDQVCDAMQLFAEEVMPKVAEAI